MKKGQNLLEYILIFSLVAVAAYAVLFKFDFKAIKNYVFMRPADSDNSNQITIEAMTGE